MKERDCANCKHHTSDGCSSWDCEFEPKDLINRADAVNAVHKYFVDAFNNEPHEIDEDGDDVFTDMKSVNALLHHNKMVSKALKALPSADAVSREECDKCKTDKEGVLLQQLAELQGDYETMKNAYEDALADVAQEWIPCSERLPKEDEYVGNVCKYYLIQDEYGDMHVAHLSGRGWETIESVKALGCDVVAWMPLPKPYRKDGEDNGED